MTSLRYRGLQFLHPVLDPGGVGGLQISLHGGLSMVEEANSVRQAILMLLSTFPGERVMRPRYGCNLQQLLFSPNDNTTAGLAIHIVRQALAQWEPRVEIVRIDANANPDDAARMDIQLKYRLRSGGDQQQLQYSINLSGA
jgi:phage baseplate assembly protein W